MTIKKYLILLGLFLSLSLQASYNLPGALNYCIVRCHEHLKVLKDVSDLGQQFHYASHLSQLYDLYYNLKRKKSWSAYDQDRFESILMGLTGALEVKNYKKTINTCNNEQRKLLPLSHKLRRWMPAVRRMSIACACLCATYYYKKEISAMATGLKNFSTDFVQSLKNTYELYKKPSPSIRYNPDVMPAPMSLEESVKSYYYVIKSAVYKHREESIKTMDAHMKEELKKEIMHHAKNSTLPNDIMKEWSNISIYELIIPYTNKKANPIAKAYLQYLFLSVANPICSVYEIVQHNMPYFSSAKKVLKLFAYASTIPLSVSIYKSAKNLLTPKKIQLPEIKRILYTMQRILIDATQYKTISPIQKGMLYHHAWCIAQESKKHLRAQEYKTFMKEVYYLCIDHYEIKQKKSLLKLMLNSYDFLQ